MKRNRQRSRRSNLDADPPLRRPDPPDLSGQRVQPRRIRAVAVALLVLGLLVPIVLPMLWGGGKDAAIATGRGIVYLLAASAACYWITRSTGHTARAVSMLLVALAWLAWTGYHTLVDLQRTIGGS